MRAPETWGWVPSLKRLKRTHKRGCHTSWVFYLHEKLTESLRPRNVMLLLRSEKICWYSWDRAPSFSSSSCLQAYRENFDPHAVILTE